MRSAILLSSLALAACGPSPTDYYPAPSPPVHEYSVDVDTDETLVTDPGKGYGIFAEYAAGGAWHVWTTCDTDVSGYLCRWDIIASVDPTETLTVTDQTELERGSDQLLRVDRGAVRLVLETGSDADGVRLSAKAGEPLSLDLEWDGPVDPASTLSWFGDGAVRVGAPSNPVDLEPTSP